MNLLIDTIRFYLVLYSFINCFFCNIFSLLLRPSQLAQKLSTGIHVKDCLFLLSPMQVLFVLSCINDPSLWNCGEEYGITRPCRGGGGGPMLDIWILKRLMLVFVNACRWLSALPSLSQFGQGRLSLVAISFYALSLLFGPCRLSEIYPGRASIITRTGG